MDILRPITYISSFLQAEKPNAARAEKIALRGLPYWAEKSCELYRLKFDGLVLDLVVLVEDLSFDQIVSLYSVLVKTDRVPKLILADNIPSKLRGGLVRNRIAHLYRDEMIFAPFLGLSYKKIPEKFEKTSIKKIGGAALRLVVCYLLREDIFQQQSSLEDVGARLESVGIMYSNVHLSRAFRQLVDADFMTSRGLGPNKRYIFNDRAEVWERLLSMDIETYSRKVAESYFPTRDDCVWSGDSALSRISDLSKPKVETVAMSTEAYNRWKSSGEHEAIPFGNFGETALEIELWSSNPNVLSDRECINPIDLSLSLRDSQDSRVRIAITELLERYGLKADLLWRTQ